MRSLIATSSLVVFIACAGGSGTIGQPDPSTSSSSGSSSSSGGSSSGNSTSSSSSSSSGEVDPPAADAGGTSSSGGNGITCGKITCTGKQTCCNASCSICTDPGEGCVQVVCDEGR